MNLDNYMNKKISIILVASLLLVAGVGCKSAQVLKPASRAPSTLEEAVRAANKTRTPGYAEGEFATEGHVILDTKTDGVVTTVYTVSSWGWFGFQNGIFTFVSGAGVIPTVITFSQNEKGEYVLQDYKEPLDGSMYRESVKRMFPANLLTKVFQSDKYVGELARQQEQQAQAYLKSVGRDAVVSFAFVEKQLPRIEAQASNALLDRTSNDARLSYFPYWLGTIERLENGTRYVYETAQGKTDDGVDVIIYTQRTENGAVVATYTFKIVGSSVQEIK